MNSRKSRRTFSSESASCTAWWAARRRCRLATKVRAMPIKFRCVYCNQLLGIARRKAGKIVACTNCGGQLIVPDTAEGSGQALDKADSEAKTEGPGGVFEQV